ncbi:hypothetical protein B0A58_14170 [Flavobacterium branchiophilum NBRC 15030 = ATCC 35035]|uniref:Lipoprotein n=2 Tax=Flavobacterium branchiophilum TaxID=55197 RepID=G2Z6X0_FLABF|nr:hypothetical protein [Flavobacterium branchiophilum]OXA70732.1 hypothetical protein B0A58_14170 [Flavobacterium branchiophilum NBRC 15030 = ATCC 35035]GEM55223.1 hypothetical protein FB1_14440 [Flavobacterium branchiophilum NBRC 15030 = ATCC 35035]CCB68966.1 Protein of unknown function precursor [Flavobacterium branchiophilum FL-15]
MNKIHILVVALFGFLLMPSNSFACGTKTEKSCCKKETTSKTEKKDCCNNKQHSKDEDKSCGGKCGHSNCTSSTTINFSLISSYEIEFKNNSFDFSAEKPKFHHSKTFISSGFTSVWLPPKIK